MRLSRCMEAILVSTAAHELTVVLQNLDLLEPHNLIPNGVWTFDGILRYGEEHKQCPYFTARRMVS